MCLRWEDLPQLAKSGLFGFVVYDVQMDESVFECTLVLEKLAELNKVDDFLMAIDSDDFGKAKALMKQAKIDSETIAIVLKKMNAADGKH